MKLITFTTKDNLELPGLLFEPKAKSVKSSSNQQKKVGIYLHGNGGSSIFYSQEKHLLYGNYLAQEGISYLAFNNRGAGLIRKFRCLDENSPEVNPEADKEKPQSILAGMSYELIKDCTIDIEAAIEYLKTLGYNEFYLIGESTGANKVVVYNTYTTSNPFSKYILLAGGDDTGIYYQILGHQHFQKLLEQSQNKIREGKGQELIPQEKLQNHFFSYQSFFDIANPDGDYNIFPFFEYQEKVKLANKELFSEYKLLNKPTLVIYGENDEYCYNGAAKCSNILQQVQTPVQKKLFNYHIIKDADHSFHGKREEVIKLIVNWLKR